MQNSNKKKYIRVLSMVLTVIMFFGMIPTQAFAQGIDEPLSGTTGTGWDDFGGDPSAEESQFTVQTEESSTQTGSNGIVSDDVQSSNTEDLNTVESSEVNNNTETTSENIPLGLSGGNMQPLPWATNLSEALSGAQTFSISGVNGAPIAWGGGNIILNPGSGNPYYIGSGNLFRITHSSGEAFCAEFNGNRPGGKYLEQGLGSNAQILKIIANYEASGKGEKDYIAAQVGIWCALLGINPSGVNWGGSGANTAIITGNANSAGATYTVHRNIDSNHTQNVITFGIETQITPFKLTIVKKDESGSKVLAGAEFKVTGPNGFNKTGTTNSQGALMMALTEEGIYTVTETSPPPGYQLSSPTSKTVTITQQSPNGSVEFRNPKDGTGDYTIRINKKVLGTNAPLAGATFTIRHTYHGVVGTITTNAAGVAVMRVPWAGTYIVEETGVPVGYIMPDDPDQDCYVDDASPTVELVFYNTPFTGVSVTKIDAKTGTKLAGAEIQIEHISTGVIYTKTTGSDGIARFEDVEPGSYYVQEIVAPEGYVLNDTRYPVELRPNEVATITIYNEPWTGIRVTKIDASTGEKLAGAEIKLKHTTSGMEYTETTGADGIAYFGLVPPGAYHVQEVKAPHGYVLNDTVYPLELKSGETATLTIQNDKKDGLYIRKVDPNGQPIAGAVFELRRGSGQVLLRETTDENGLIFRGYLTTDTYVIEEIQAPEGYLLDGNNPQSIFIDETDDNKEYTVTFVNQKKPSIEIIKVDADNPNKVLANAHFKISRQGGSESFDIYTGTDGKAKIDNLEVGVTYVIEEIQAPNGYVNSGYNKTIVLEEGKVHTVTVSNHREPGLKIVKKDADTGRVLYGATFRLSWNGGANFKDYTTDMYGEINVADLTPGTYILKEIKAPNGYILDDTERTVILKNGEDTIVEITNSLKPTLRILKKDKTTGEFIGSGATFRISWNAGANFRDVTTDEFGESYIEGLSEGWYTVTEIRSPEGYILDSTPHQILLTAGEVKVLEITNTLKPALRILKKDKATGELLGSGATFRISWNSGADFRDVTTNNYGEVFIEDLAEGWYTVAEIRSPEGYLLDKTPHEVILKGGEITEIEIFNEKKPSLEILKVDNVTKTPLQYAKFKIEKKTDTGTELIGEHISNEDGIVFLDNIYPGRYFITEIEAPDGYNIDTATHEITIEYGQQYKLEFTNTPKSPIYIQKVDEQGNPLRGAQFKITTMNGAMVGTVTSGITGFAILPYCEPGWYIVQEIRSPEGYILNNTPVNIEVKSGRPAEVQFVNEKAPGFELLKIDKETREPIENTVFKITSSTGEAIGEFTTDINGRIFIPEIDGDIKTIVVTEIRSSDGYILDNTPHTVELKPNETVTIVLHNQKKPSFELLKIDKETREPIENTVFKITSSTGEAIGEFTTDINGRIFIPEIDGDIKTIVVTEIRSSGGYILDNTPHTIELKPNEATTITLYNQKKPALEILKVDADTRNTLIGAIFKVAKANGEFVGEYTSDSNGLIRIENLEVGVYIVSEVRSPDGYLLDITPQTVELKAGTTERLTFTNVGKPGLQLVKKDKITDKPIGGAKFNITELKGASKVDHGTFTTGENGLFYIPNLEPGYYVITEIQAAPGYILDSTPKQMYIEGGKLNAIEFYNMPYASFKLLKIDSETRKPLEGAVFKLFSESRIEIGTYETTALGEIVLPEIEAGTYYLQEVKAPAGYILDNTVHKIELIGGKTTTIEIKNTELGSLRIVKIDAKTKKPLYGATFNLYDSKNNLLGEFTTIQDGTISFGKNLQAGTYKVKETKAPDGYVLNDKIFTIQVKSGETTVFEIENTPKEGRIQITKVAAAFNDITKDKEGKGLQGVEFEVFDNQMKLVDTMVTDKNGIATSIDLPLGVYGIKEVKSADYYFTDGEMFYADIKIHEDLVKFTVKNEPVTIETTVEKRGNDEVQAGDSMYYDFSNIENKSNVPLEDFYIHDILPTDAVRLEKIWTGVWSERVKFDVQIKTNKKSNYKTIKTGLLSNVNNEIDCSPSALGLGGGEYITEFKIVFKQEVQPGFKCTTGPKIKVKTLDITAPAKGKCMQFTNKVDVGGRHIKEWTYSTDGWTVIIWCVPKGDLPKTGY